MRIDKIDGWRFWAVCAVIVSHLIYHSQYYSTIDSEIRVEGFGLLGVEVFFFISGFVICSALIKELETHGRFSIKAFYIRRCFRILPPLWIYLLVISVAGSYGLIEFNMAEAWIPALFVSNLESLFTLHWFVGHTWTLSYEEQFYIVFPIILWISYRANRMMVFPLLIILFPILSLLCYYFHMEIGAGVFRFFDFMVWGVVFAIYKEDINKKLSLVGFVLPVILSLMMVVISIIPASKFSTILTVFILPPLVAITVASTVFNESAMERLLTSKWLCYLGRASYGIYLWQQVATAKYAVFGGAFYFLAILGMISYVVFQYEFIEKRLIRVGSNISKNLIEKEIYLKCPREFRSFP
jgi:peptidoglycan/LPS O-acetylase OafA/YrhL